MNENMSVGSATKIRLAGIPAGDITRRGWGVGTLIRADFYDGSSLTLRITGIGEELVLCRVLRPDGRESSEHVWGLLDEEGWYRVEEVGS